MENMSKIRSMALLLGLAICFSFSDHVVLGSNDPDEVLDFCVAVLPGSTAATAVWQTGTEQGTGWGAPSDQSTQVGVAIPFNETTDSDFPCKPVKSVTVNDFVFKGLGSPQKVTSKLGSKVTKATVTEFPALNTLGISAARVDFVKNGLNPPHEHPRATEVLRVLSGSLLVGFVDTGNTLFTQTLQAGDLFVFPKGQLHFQMEVGQGEASGLATFDSQNPGTLQVIEALLSSSPPFPANVIEAAFQINKQTLGSLAYGVSQLNH